MNQVNSRVIADYTDLSGQTTEDLRIIACLARGGMSDVYLADSKLHDHPIVVKFERADLEQELGGSRFEREIALHRRAPPAAVPRFLHAGHAFGLRFIAMEHIAGLDLSLLTRRDPPHSGPPEAALVIDLFYKAFQALGKLAAHGIIHRDIKPANIILAADGRVLLCDLGIATVTGAEPFTEKNRVMGTVGYMSPEQLGGLLLDVRTDIYSMGIAMFEVMTGFGVIARQDHDVAVYPDFLVPEHMMARLGEAYPPGLVDVVKTCLQVDRRLRYANPERALRALQRARDALARDGAARDLPPEPRLWRWTDAAIFALFALMLLAYFAW